MYRIVRIGLTLVLGSVVGLSAGCGSGSGALAPADAEDDLHKGMLREVGEMLTLYKASNGKPPGSVADLAKYEVGFQIGYLRTQDGTVVVLWGAPLDAGASDKVIAYEKAVPDSGGYVLMQDGTTVKKMTADEFKSAPKAPGKASEPAKKK